MVKDGEKLSCHEDRTIDDVYSTMRQREPWVPMLTFPASPSPALMALMQKVSRRNARQLAWKTIEGLSSKRTLDVSHSSVGYSQSSRLRTRIKGQLLAAAVLFAEKRSSDRNLTTREIRIATDQPSPSQNGPKEDEILHRLRQAAEGMPDTDEIEQIVRRVQSHVPMAVALMNYLDATHETWKDWDTRILCEDHD